MPKHRKLWKWRGGLAEKLVDLDSGRWVVGDDIVPVVGTILLGFRCPENPHASPEALVRCATNLPSTSSLDRPWPARIEVRAISTLRCRNSSYSRAWRWRWTNSRITSRTTCDAAIGRSHVLTPVTNAQLS